MEPKILYHYCSSATLVSILTNRSIWLSSLTLSNDSMEGRLVTETLMRVATNDKLDRVSQSKLRDSIAFVERFVDGLGFCLSERGDVLSQWRGYADDGRGVCIGFNRSYLDALSQTSGMQSSAGFSLHKVRYQTEEHRQLVEPTYRELKKLIAAGAFRQRGTLGLLELRTHEQITKDDDAIDEAHRGLIMQLLEIVPMLFQLKDEAFVEEAEWRLVSMLGGKRFEDCLFRATGAKVVPYRKFALEPLEHAAIAEVVLGPKHETPESVVHSLLLQAGFQGVAVRRSSATYR